VCHHILVCFTAYDKYKAHIDQNYGGGLINYLRSELPMFYRSCEAASRTVVRDYTEYDNYGGSLVSSLRNYLRSELSMFYRSCKDASRTVVRDCTEYEKGRQKLVSVKCIAAAPVIAQRPTAEVKHERVGKPPIGFDIRNKKHSWGIEQIEKWLCECEQSERKWSMIDEEMENHIERLKIIIYRVLPIVTGTVLGFCVPFCLTLLNVNHALTFTKYVFLFFKCLIFGGGIGAGLGFLAGDKAKVSITQTDGFVFKETTSTDNSNGDEEQDESATGTGGTSTGSRSYETWKKRYWQTNGTGGTSTASPSPSRRGGTSGSVDFDDDDDE